MKPETSATLKVLALGCVIIFLVFIGIATPFYLRQRTVVKTWPITRATVESANIAPVNGRHGTNYMARFLVQYRVGDQILSTTVPSGYADANRSHAQQWLDSFPVGSTVMIAYNPEDPALVRLNPGYNRFFFAVPLFITKVGSIFGAAAVLLMVIARWGDSRYKRTNTPNRTAG